MANHLEKKTTPRYFQVLGSIQVLLGVVVLWMVPACGRESCDILDAKRQFESSMVVSGPYSIDEVENMESTGEQRLAFGKIHNEWKELKSTMIIGDCIFRFSSARDDWGKLSGREGYIIMRNGEPVDAIITEMN